MTVILSLLLATAPAPAEWTAEVTAYCNAGPRGCRICCGKWAKHNRTKSGPRPKAGVTVAGPRSIPFGTVVHIEGVGRRIVQDRLAPERDNSFDVFMPRHADAKKFGKRKLKVRIIQTDTKKTK